MNLDDILNDVYLECPGCANQILKQQLRLVCRDFCFKTNAWTEEITKDIVADTDEYNLNTGANANINHLIWVKYGEDATLDTTTALDAGQYRLVDEWTLKLLFSPTAAITDGLCVKVALRPTYSGVSDGTVDFPEWFLDRYADGLAAGTKAKIMRMPKKPWTDFEMSRYYDQLMNQAIIRARDDASYAEFKDTPVTVEMRSI